MKIIGLLLGLVLSMSNAHSALAQMNEYLESLAKSTNSQEIKSIQRRISSHQNEINAVACENLLTGQLLDKRRRELTTLYFSDSRLDQEIEELVGKDLDQAFSKLKAAPDNRDQQGQILLSATETMQSRLRSIKNNKMKQYFHECENVMLGIYTCESNNTCTSLVTRIGKLLNSVNRVY